VLGLGIDAFGPDVRPFEFSGLRVRCRGAISHGADIGFIRRRQVPKEARSYLTTRAYQHTLPATCCLTVEQPRGERSLELELFAATGDIRISDSELHITLAPLSSPHRTLAAQALCKTLDQTATIFPGSRLRVRFSVRPPPRIGLAFPGSPVERSNATAIPQAP